MISPAAQSLISKAEALDRVDRLKKSMHAFKKRAEVQTEHVMTALMSWGAGAALGAADARFGADPLMGVPTSLAIGFTANIAAMADVGGADAAPLLRAVGNAGLAIHGYQMGFEVIESRTERGTAPRTTPRISGGGEGQGRSVASDILTPSYG